MKKKVMAVILTVAMTMTMGMTAFAASSTTSSNSGNVGVAVEKAAPGAVVNTDKISVVVANASGGTKAVTLTEYLATATETVSDLIADKAAAGENAGAAVSELMTRAATPMFQATINALNGKVGFNNCGTVKTVAIAQDAFGNNIASAGKIENVTAGSLVMLMSVDTDGTVEIVEGVVDPATGLILGIFQGTPKTITVLVVIPQK